jgi:glucan phosphorylase
MEQDINVIDVETTKGDIMTQLDESIDNLEEYAEKMLYLRQKVYDDVDTLDTKIGNLEECEPELSTADISTGLDILKGCIFDLCREISNFVIIQNEIKEMIGNE